MIGDRNEWLAGLKAGDEVAIPFALGWTHNTYVFRRVTRTTPTQIIVDDVRYQRRTGSAMAPHRGALVIPTEEVRKKAAIADDLRWLEDLTSGRIDRFKDKIPPVVIRAMREAYDKAMQEQPT